MKNLKKAPLPRIREPTFPQPPAAEKQPVKIVVLDALQGLTYS